jgi:hypothetical protein
VNADFRCILILCPLGRQVLPAVSSLCSILGDMSSLVAGLSLAIPASGDGNEPPLRKSQLLALPRTGMRWAAQGRSPGSRLNGGFDLPGPAWSSGLLEGASTFTVAGAAPAGAKLQPFRIPSSLHRGHDDPADEEP